MTRKKETNLLHIGVVALLAVMFFILPDYHDSNLARIMVLAIYAMGYNLLFGYTGLLSLGHALFFAAGMYGFGLSMRLFELPAVPAFLVGISTSILVSAVIGFLALRTVGVAFMIVTLMFSQVGFLTILLYGEYTRGDEGFVIQQAERVIAGFDLTIPINRYFAALLLFSVCFLGIAYIVNSSFGRCLVAIRENEERAQMLGYDVTMQKFIAVVISGTISGIAGAAYALLFGYAGATFASVQYSIYPLLWVLLGGAGTTVGPLVGTAFAFYLVDISSDFTSAYLLVVGLTIVLVTLFAPQGLVGTLRQKYLQWLP